MVATKESGPLCHFHKPGVLKSRDGSSKLLYSYKRFKGEGSLNKAEVFHFYGHQKL